MFKVSDFPPLLLSEFDPQTPVSRLQPRERAKGFILNGSTSPELQLLL